MNYKIEDKFDQTPIGKLVLQLGIPAMAAQFFNVLYSIVDRVFVGHIEGEGTLSLAAIGVCAPALTLISAFAYMVGIGGASVLSISLGEKDHGRAQKAINSAFVMLILIGMLVTAAALCLKRPLLFALGSSENIFPAAERYFTIYAAGTVFSLVGTGMNQFLLAQGFARQGMLSLMLGTVVNILLDPLLIFGCHMGIAGAAYATVSAQLVTFLYVLVFLLRRDPPVSLKLGGYDPAVIRRILYIGIMPFAITAMDNLILIFMNMSLRRWGGTQGDAYIAAAAVIQSFMALINCPGQGITSGCGTLFAYHYGAGNLKKVMETFRHVLLLCLAFIGILLVAVQTAPEIFVSVFMKNAAQAEETCIFLRRYTLGLPGIAVQLAYVDGLTAMGKVTYAFPLSFFRKCVYIAALLLLPAFFAPGYIFYAGTIADLVGASFTLTVFYAVIRRKLTFAA